MDTSSDSNENNLKKAIENWSDFKLKQYYSGYKESACFTPALFDIPQDFMHAAFKLVKAEMTNRGLLS